MPKAKPAARSSVKIADRAPMTQEEIEEGLERLKPFLLRVELPFGLETSRHNRLQDQVAHAWGTFLGQCGGSLDGMRVLDCACVNGGFSFQAAKAGAKSVWGFDIVPEYVEQARFLRDALRLKNVDFDVLDLKSLTPETNGMFDISLFFGILYHLEDPIGALRQVAAVTKRILFVDTRLMPVAPQDKRPLFMFATMPAFDENSTDTNMVGKWRKQEISQLMPSRIAVERALKFLGFKTVIFVEPDKERSNSLYMEGKLGSFIAIR